MINYLPSNLIKELVREIVLYLTQVFKIGTIKMIEVKN